MENTKYDVILLTESRYENPLNPDWYEQQILNEDGVLIAALEAEGLRVKRLNWATPDFDWTSCRLAVFRTTWDYFNRIQEFIPWLDKVGTMTQLVNSYELVRWNIDKHYLIDLHNKGIHIVTTELVEHGGSQDLSVFFEAWHCEDLIIKPCIGGTARHTYRVDKQNIAELQLLFDQLVTSEAMLIQPFQKNILLQGELSILLFGGKYSHAVHKIAKSGDFRVQDDFGGTAFAYDATESEIAFAENAVLACPTMPAYARIDVIYDNDGRLAISELEAVEPELFFRFRPEAGALLVKEIIKCL